MGYTQQDPFQTQEELGSPLLYCAKGSNVEEREREISRMLHRPGSKVSCKGEPKTFSVSTTLLFPTELNMHFPTRVEMKPLHLPKHHYYLSLLYVPSVHSGPLAPHNSPFESFICQAVGHSAMKLESQLYSLESTPRQLGLNGANCEWFPR